LNPVVLRLRLTGDQTFRNVLAHAHEVVTGALSYAEMPFHLLVATMRSGADQSRHPVYQVQFSLEPTMLARYPGWDLTPMDLQSGGARLDLYFVLDDRPDGMFGRVQYNPDLFEAASIERMAHHYQALLTAAIADPDKRISTLPRCSFHN
jgi:surfactin family lipopeptide synthetase A